MSKKFFLGLSLLLWSCQSTNSKSEPSSTHSKGGGAFESASGIMGVPRQLTFSGPRAGEGYFSPDGQYMIFQSEREPGNPFYQMYLMNLSSGKVTRLSPGQGKTTCGWIHPNLQKTMWSSTHLDPKVKSKVEEEYQQRKQPVKAKYAWSYDEHFDIFESDMKGRQVRRLTKELGYDAEGSYSPDGQWIAFASNRAGYSQKLSEEDDKLFKQDPSYMMDIYIMKADGSSVKQLTTSKGYDGGPFFSADGKKITWRRFAPNGATAEVYTMNIDGSDQKQITRLNSMSWAPYFYPSGDYIIFSSTVGGYSNFELFVVDSEGKKDPVRVSFDEGFDGLAVFSPDGQEISWTHRNEKGESQIYRAPWDDVKARAALKLPTPKEVPQGFSPEIREQDLRQIIGYLSDPSMGGRKAGSPEEKIYAQQIATWLKSWGLEGGGPRGEFLQSFPFVSGVKLGQKNSLEILGSSPGSLKPSQDYEPLSISANGEFRESPVVFAGYGLQVPAAEGQPEYDSYKNIDVKGKWVLILQDLPEDIKPERKLHLNLYARTPHKVTIAKKAGAVGVIIAPSPYVSGDTWGLKFDGTLVDSSVAVVKVSQAWMQKLLDLSGRNTKTLLSSLDRGEVIEGFPIPSVYLKAQVDLQFEKTQGLNILAKIPVNGKRAVLIGAHGDHLGRGEFGSSLAKGDDKGQVHGGADDNASGVAGVLELAHHYVNYHRQNPGSLKKDLYFAIWSAEEIGLLGSTHFTRHWSEISKIPLKNYFSAYLNMDMIGRLKDRLSVQGVGSGNQWTSLAEEVGSQSSVPLSLQSDPYLPTDSMALYLAGVPGINFFTGVHSQYHSPRDTMDLINLPGTVQVVNTVRLFTQVLSDTAQDRVKYIKAEGHGQGQGGGRSFRLFLGTIPDYSQEGVKGVRISGVSKESPAEKAGLKDKDIIVEFSGAKIENIYDYVNALQVAKPDKETAIKIRRGGELVELRITPRLKE